MLNLNRAMILGNLTRDPEVRSTPAGQSVATFAVATNRRWTTKEGQTQESAEYHDVVAWGKLAEICQQFLKKGQRVYVEGRLQTRSWEGQDGAKRNRTEIIAENVISLDRSPVTAGAFGEATKVDTRISTDIPASAPDGPASAPDGDIPLPPDSGDEKTPVSAHDGPASATDEGKKKSASAPAQAPEDEITLDDIPF
jgi:single-strand DNA-binding protein